MKRTSAFLALALASGATVACSPQAKTYSSQCAYVIGDGTGDNRGLKEIVYPGEKVDVGDDIVRFVPCGARDYVVANRDENRDRKEATIAKTGAGDGNGAPTELSIYWSAYWNLNQDRDTLTAFLPFCEKYNCYSDSDDVSGANNFATDGWVGMLNQNMSPAADRAIAEALLKFGPDVWDNRSEWTQLADEISKAMGPQLRTVTRSGDRDYFCGGGDTRNDPNACAPVTFAIDAMKPTDPRVEQQQKDAKAIDSAVDLTADRITQNKQLYGPLSEYYTGLHDTLRVCKEQGQQCTVVIGTPPAGVNVPTPAS